MKTLNWFGFRLYCCGLLMITIANMVRADASEWWIFSCAVLLVGNAVFAFNDHRELRERLK